jgi:hypothetical protein
MQQKQKNQKNQARQKKNHKLVRGPSRQRSGVNLNTTLTSRRLGKQSQIGNVISPRSTSLGMPDLRNMTLKYVTGYTFVGNGTNGDANAVYFVPYSGGTPKWLVQGYTSTYSSGMIPIAPADPDLGNSAMADVLKHYSRIVIKKAWIYLNSLQPSTTNNMMVVLAPARGAGGAATSWPVTFATASVTANTVPGVESMKGSDTCGSWENHMWDCTDFIAGGSGARQNEFDLQTFLSGDHSIYVTTATVPSIDLDGVVPFCFSVGGNNTTSALQNTNVHTVSIELEVDLLDWVGLNQMINPT